MKRKVSNIDIFDIEYFRQLNLYGCIRIRRGKDREAYYHPCLLRRRPDLLGGMKRVTLKGNEIQNQSEAEKPENNPDFYRMKPIPPFP